MVVSVSGRDQKRKIEKIYGKFLISISILIFDRVPIAFKAHGYIDKKSATYKSTTQLKIFAVIIRKSCPKS